MSGILDIGVTLAGRRITFKMTYDENVLSDKHMVMAINADGCAEPEVAQVMARVLKEGDTAVDGGANIGFFTVLMAKLVGPSGLVIACEPAQNNLWKLEANIRLNNLDNVRIERRPLWSKVEKVTFHMADDGGAGSLMPSPDTRGKVEQQAVRLLDLFAPFEARAKLVKLDVEGAEAHALRGLGPLLDPVFFPYVICELNCPALNQFGSTQGSLRTLMDLAGYHTFLLPIAEQIPAFVPSRTKIQTTDPQNGQTRLNCNILFTTFDRLSEAWPEAPAWQR